MLAFPVRTLFHPSYETNERFLMRMKLAGHRAGGGWPGQGTEYVMWIETECEVLLKGGVGKGREGRRKGAKMSSH